MGLGILVFAISYTKYQDVWFFINVFRAALSIDFIVSGIDHTNRKKRCGKSGKRWKKCQTNVISRVEMAVA